MEILQHGEARLRNEPVPGRLCRPPGICAWSLALRHFTEQVRDLAGSVYGRRMYEVMRYWDEDHPEWDAEERDFAAVWGEPTEVGRVALAEVSWPQRHACRG